MYDAFKLKRYEVSGFDRELHGALLDSPDSWNVYLSMTGGARAFIDFIDESVNPSDDKLDISSAEHTSLNLKLVKLSEEEEKNHKKYLERMKKKKQA